MLEVGNDRVAFTSAQDLDLIPRLGERGRLANLPDVLLECRQHPASIRRARFREQRDCVRRIVREAHERRGLEVPELESVTFDGLAPIDGDTWRRWAQSALGAGHRRTAIRYAQAVWRAEPSLANAVLCVRAFLGLRLGWLRRRFAGLRRFAEPGG